MTTQSISANALAVLREIECDADRARITSGQLDRPLYEEVNEVLVRLGGKWKGGRTKAHLFPYDPRPLLAGVLATGEMPPKNPWAFFPTPSPLVASVMESPLFDEVCDGDTVLEPSAGFGALAEGMRKRLAHRQVQIDCCEILPINQQVLRDKGFAIVATDFLTYQPEKRYRAIVMNPPFSVEADRLAYITHIRHAWELLADGGFLIAFAPSGYTFRSDKKSSGFLSFILTYGGWEALPARSFHESGTDSAITQITLQKQDQSWRYNPYNGYPTWFCYELYLLADNGTNEVYRTQRSILEQLNRGELCADATQPTWKQTQAVIHDYYQEVMADARRNGHRHIDIRPQDWPFLERKFMKHWNEDWEAGAAVIETLHEEPERKGPVVLEEKGAASEALSLCPPQDARADASIMTEEPVEPVISSPLSTGTKMYSPFPSDMALSYEHLCELGEQELIARDAYAPLPWVMEELIGTTWRNIHTGESQTVHHLGLNRFHKPVLCRAPAPVSPAGGEHLECIGFWSGDRYLVEQWLRVDQQSEELQLCWFGIELAWLRKCIACCERKLMEYQYDAPNAQIQKRVKQDYQGRLQEAERRMREFAALHHLAIPLHILNSGLLGSELAPAQMALL